MSSNAVYLVTLRDITRNQMLFTRSWIDWRRVEVPVDGIVRIEGVVHRCLTVWMKVLTLCLTEWITN